MKLYALLTDLDARAFLEQKILIFWYELMIFFLQDKSVLTFQIMLLLGTSCNFHYMFSTSAEETDGSHAFDEENHIVYARTLRNRHVFLLLNTTPSSAITTAVQVFLDSIGIIVFLFFFLFGMRTCLFFIVDLILVI